jgi:hypothetical protein
MPHLTCREQADHGGQIHPGDYHQDNSDHIVIVGPIEEAKDKDQNDADPNQEQSHTRSLGNPTGNRADGIGQPGNRK